VCRGNAAQRYTERDHRSNVVSAYMPDLLLEIRISRGEPWRSSRRNTLRVDYARLGKKRAHGWCPNRLQSESKRPRVRNSDPDPRHAPTTRPSPRPKFREPISTVDVGRGDQGDLDPGRAMRLSCNVVLPLRCASYGARDPVEFGNRLRWKFQRRCREIFAEMADRRCAGNEENVGSALQ
jgi:hypothetical protein